MKDIVISIIKQDCCFHASNFLIMYSILQKKIYAGLFEYPGQAGGHILKFTLSRLLRELIPEYNGQPTYCLDPEPFDGIIILLPIFSDNRFPAGADHNPALFKPCLQKAEPQFTPAEIKNLTRTDNG